MASDASPWKLGGLTVRELARRVWEEIDKDEIVDRAAGLAYYFLFALFPALLFLTALIGLLPIPHLLDRLMEYVSQALPVDAASVTQKTLREIIGGAHGGLLSIGVLGALWAASNGMSSIITALNAVYDVPEMRPFWKRKALAMAYGLRLYVSRFADYNATYGSIGGVILLMLWLYLSGAALLLGAEINAVIEQGAAERGAADAKAEGEVVPGEAALPANVFRLPVRPTVRAAASVTEGVARLARLEVELAVSETKR